MSDFNEQAAEQMIRAAASTQPFGVFRQPQ